MKFGKTLEKHTTPEWRQHYIRYQNLKEMIRSGIDNVSNLTQASQIEEFCEVFANEFFTKLMQELRRVDEFFEYKLAEARRKHATFKVKLMYMVRSSGGQTDNIPKLPPLADQPKNARQFGRAFSEFYFSLALLSNFQHVNLTGFHKICKKFDKNFQTTKGKLWLQKELLPMSISNDRAVKDMIVDVENLYTEFLAKGDRTKAMSRLRVPPLGSPPSPWHVFFAGVLLGLFIVSAIICLISVYTILDNQELLSIFSRLYRGPVALVFYGFSIVICIYVWQNVGVNHVLIFELNPRTKSEPDLLLAIVSFFGYLCTVSMLVVIHHKEFGIQDPLYVPLVCIGVPLILLINPFPVMKYQGRKWLLNTLCRVIAAPFFNVTFADFWVADQLLSLLVCLVDHYQVVRFYIRYSMSNVKSFDFEPDYAVPVIRCLPAWFRLAQCLRRYWDTKYKTPSHVVNGFTYGSTIIVIIISTVQMETNYKYKHLFDNPWLWCYVVSSIVSSIYCSAWDILQDFGLFIKWRGENIFLRENLIYPLWFYYVAIVSNVAIRFVWVLELNLIYFDLLLPYYSKTLCSLLEIVRKCIWNLLRMENEHLYNCGNYRATRDIFVSALNSREDLLLETMLAENQSISADA